uniref:Uncharacterized protein n=1 Tax=Rhizophora mucronata TaxID=61149 RepID=A0A2P2L6Y7_RHIMU
MSKEIASQALSSEESAPDVDQIVGEVPQTDGVKTVGELDSPEEIASQALSSEVPVSDKVAKSQYNIATDENTFNSENEISSETAVDNEGLGATADDSGSITAADVQQGVASHQQTKDRVESLGKSDSPVDTSNALTSEGQNDEEVQNRVENTKGELLTEAPAAENEFSPVLNEDERKVESASEKNDTNSNPNGHSASLSSKENGTKGFNGLYIGSYIFVSISI